MKPVSTDISFPKMEEKLLLFWKEKNVFQRSMDSHHVHPSLKRGTARKSYVFYDGPPFATGLPHYGHLLAGTIKDVVGRFFTMKGYHVDRRLGWDCHGVPIEFEIQKNFNLKGAKSIKEFGVSKFNEECRKIVLRYTKEWEQFIERSGRWVDFERQYRSMDLDYMESIWWVIKSLWNRGLIYEGLKCVPYSCGMNTPLSNFEANLNYKNVQDPAVTVRARITGNLGKLGVKIPEAYQVSALAWTTTPWTLPSNMALAVGPDIEYSLVANHQKKEILIIANSLLKNFFPTLATDGQPDLNVEIIEKVLGKNLEGIDYQPFFPYFEKEREGNAFKIYTADFVEAEEGTGIVHCASFGEEDLALFKKYNISVVDTLDEDGNFKEIVSDFSGLYFKEADPKIISALKAKGLLFEQRTIEHSYPYCWRTDTPLIYRSVSSWFVAVESIKDLLIHNNKTINWTPAHIRDGRFGNWLENTRDWSISRDRYWGTPLPIWKCQSCDQQICLGSVQELEELSGEKITDLHSHYIDHLTFKCERCSSEMKRIPQVLDCWFESGSMPYAQEHYPFENKEQFESGFPADFIAEGLDQTRGWFYTLLVLSTALFGETAFKNVIVNGIVLAEDGKKMSKSLKNYPPPSEVLEELGADAMRLYLLSSPATRAEDLRFTKEGVRNVVRQTLLPLWNAYNFFVTYALVDNWTPEKIPETASENLLDRWILSKVASLIEGVDTTISSYHLYGAAHPILEFVEQLTNWYIRLNRRRFWSGNTKQEIQDKMQAYSTLHQVLLCFVRVLAPLAPFVSEEIFQNLSKGVKGLDIDSVHLCSFPTIAEVTPNRDKSVLSPLAANMQTKSVIDQALEKGMELFEEVILLGRSLRNEQGLKVRQPLAKLTIIYPKENDLRNLKQLEIYIKDELNFKEVDFTTDETRFVTLKAKLNTKLLGKTLGPKLGRDGMKRLQDFVMNLSSEQIKVIESGGKLKLDDMELCKDEILVERAAAGGTGGLATASSGQITIAIDTMLSPELELEGFAREFVNRVQKLRKDFGFEVSDRIAIKYMTACSKLPESLSKHQQYVMEETLAIELKAVKSEKEMVPQANALNNISSQEIEGKTVIIGLTRIQG